MYPPEASPPLEYDHSPDLLRLPPHSIQSEQSILGGLMLDNQTWDQIADRLVRADFYRKEHQLLFELIGKLINEGKPCDIITLSEALDAAGQLENAGGINYIATLARETPSAANIRAYADIVRERSILRQLIRVGNEIADEGFNPGGRGSDELVDEAERRVFEIADQRARGGGGFQAIKSLLTKAVDRIETLYQRDEAITGVATGYSDFDGMTSGLQPADLIIVAGRPSMGKTTFAMNIAEHVAIKEKRPVAVFSMEMPGESLAMRMMSSLGRIDQHRVRTGKLEDDEWPRLTSAVSLLSGASLFIDDTPALSPTEVRARARRLKREQGDLALIVLDYLQLMQVPGQGDNRTNEISTISRSLKALAKELNVPLIALSQLNRSLEQRPDKRPKMSDLRECVTGDTQVLLADGRAVAIRQLVGQTPHLLALDSNHRVTSAQSDAVWSVGVKPVFTLHLASGRTLRCTARHRLLTYSGWQRLAELTPGDRVAICRSLPEPQGAIKTLQKASSDDLFWDRITAIEPAGEEEVFDLTVPALGNWLSNGIVSHNSGAIEQDADVIVFIYRDEVYNEDSADKGTAEIIIGKQRNGPIGKVRLTFLGKYTKFENFIDDVYSGGGYS